MSLILLATIAALPLNCWIGWWAGKQIAKAACTLLDCE